MDQNYPVSCWVCPCGGVLEEKTNAGTANSNASGTYVLYRYKCAKCKLEWLLEIIWRPGHEESSWRKLTDA